MERRTSGGSSGGSSSSVASGMGPLAIGTDGGECENTVCLYWFILNKTNFWKRFPLGLYLHLER